MSELKQGDKKKLILQRLEAGMVNAREIWKDIAATGVVVDISHITRITREYDLKGRVDNGVFNQFPTQPYAVSGITGNKIVNKYLETIESQGGGFLKTAVYDIETTGLYADFGYILSCCFKDVDSGEIKVFRLDETKIFQEHYSLYKADKKSGFNDPEFWDVIDIELVDMIRKEFEKYNLVLTWNGKWFDEMFLHTRLLRCGLPGLNPGVKHMDVMQLGKRVLKTRSMKQDAIKNFLRIDEEPDTHSWAQWRMAAAGIKEGFDFVCDHNIKDVEQLHQIAQKLRDHTKAWFF
jgi:DNA polymerase III alpha subunit (gram-positive type)